jgi:hypothetical protein
MAFFILVALRADTGFPRSALHVAIPLLSIFSLVGVGATFFLGYILWRRIRSTGERLNCRIAST